MNHPRNNLHRRRFRATSHLLVGGGFIVAAGALTAPACDVPMSEPMEPPAACSFNKSIVVASGELIREKGNPWRDITIEVPATGTYELTLENDGLAGFAVNTADGEPLITPDAFNAHPTEFTWTGELTAGSYQLKVRLAGKPGKSVRYQLMRRVVSAEATIVTAFTVLKDVPQDVELCGGLTRLSFGADALADADASVDFIAECTARECIDPELASDRLEVHQADGTGYVFNAPLTLAHPRVPHSVRRLAGEVIDAVEDAAQVINEEQLVIARSSIPHFSPIEDEFSCGKDVPIIALPFEGKYYISQANNNTSYTHKGNAGRYAVDFALPLGSSALAVTDGLLHWTPGTEADYGHWHLLLEYSPGKYYRYGHCEAVSPALVEKGLTENGSIQVSAGDEVCITGDEGFTDGPHLHADLVAIADPTANPNLAVSQPHGFIALNHGMDSSKIVPAKLQVFCPIEGDDDECTEDPVSLADKCVSPGLAFEEKKWTEIERSSGTSCEAQAEQALGSGQLFSDLKSYPDHPANKLRLAEATNQIYIGSPPPGCPFRPEDAQTRIETAKVLLTAAAGDGGILDAIDGFFEENPECQAALAEQFADFDVIAGHWGRDVLAYTATVCNQPIAFFEGRLHDDDGLRYADLDAPILAIEAAKLLVELGRDETIQIGDAMFEIPDGLNDLYDTYEAYAAGELDDSPYTDNTAADAWYVDYLDAMGHERVQCPDGAGGFGVADAMGVFHEVHREEVADWLHRILQLTSDQRTCN